MARDIVAVPVSTVSSESCFSLTGRILEERRRRLLPEHVEMLTCIKDWDQAKRKAQHTVEDTELVQLFKTMKVGDAVPEDEDTATDNVTVIGSTGTNSRRGGSSGRGRGG
jgi:hypothetical protein